MWRIVDQEGISYEDEYLSFEYRGFASVYKLEDRIEFKIIWWQFWRWIQEIPYKHRKFTALVPLSEVKKILYFEPKP